MSQVDHSDSGTENNNSPPPQAPTSTLFIPIYHNPMLAHCLLQYRNGLFQGFANEFNQRQGKGIYIWNTGEVYYGSWTHDCMEGEGIFYFSLGGYVYGTFLNNKVHGYAILYFQDGDYLAGFWQEGILIGKVIQHSREADEWFLYEYKNGSPSRTISQGKGSPPLNSFSTLETGYLKKLLDKELNLFKEDNSENKGQQKNLEFLPIDPTGWYHGNTRSKKPYGLGIVCYSENRSDRGQFRKGDMNGPGRSIFANNDVYEGFYVDGKFSGTGVYFKGESEQHLYGTYEDNECVQPITLGEGYPHDLMRDIKTEFVMERAEFIDQETEAEVLKLFSPNQENHEQQQTQEQPSSAQIETEPKTETEPEVEVAVKTEGESEPEVQVNHDNIIKRQIEMQVAENMVRKEAQEHYYEEEDDDVDSEEDEEEEEEEYNNGEFLKELDSMGGPSQNIVAQSQVETKVVEQVKSAARDFSQKSNSIEQNVKETVSVHARDPSSGYSSVGGKVVESRNVVYFEEEEDEHGRKWTSIHQVVSKQGSSDKGMTSSNPSIKSIKEEFKDNKGYDTNKRAIKMTEILENHSISKEDTESNRITSEAHDTRQSGYSDKRVSLPINPMNPDLNSLKREVKKDSIFKSSKESTPMAYQSVSSNIRTEETDLNAFRDIGWTEEEEKIDSIVAHIRNKNEMKARGMDSVGSSISNHSSVQGRPFSLVKEEHADGPLLGKFSSVKSHGSIKDVINEVKMSIKKEPVPVHQGGYIVRESVVTERLLAKPLQPEPSRQSRLKSDSSVDTTGSDKGAHQTHIKTDIQKIMNEVLEKSRINSRNASNSPDAKANGDSGIKKESASKGVNKIADLEYSQPTNVNPGVQKAVTDFIHSISYQSGAKENANSRVPGAININDSMAKNTSGTASLETSLMEKERDAPKLYHGGSFGAVSSGHYDQHSSARGHPDQQTSRFGQTLDIPGIMDFHRERASTGQSGGNPGSNSGVFNNNHPIVVETQEIIPEKRQSMRQSLTQMNPILVAAMTKEPPKYSMPIDTLTLTIPEQRSPMHQEQLRSPEFCNTRLNGLENAAQFPITSPFLLHENYIHPKDRQTENPVKSGVRTAQVTEESLRTGNTNNSVRLDTMSNRGDTPSNRIDSASNRIETISGRIDTGSSESWTGSAHTCSERSVAASLTTSQILRKYGLDTYQENPGSRPDLIKKLIVPIEQNRRASIVYMKRKDPKEKDFQEVSHHAVPEKEKEKAIEVVKEIEKEKEQEKEKAAQRLEEELYKVIVLKLELMVKEQNKMTEAVDGVRKVLNEKLDVLFKGDQKEKEIYKSDFTSTIDVMLQQKTRDMTLDQVMKMYNEMKEHFKHLENSVSGINNKLERLLERQGQGNPIPVVINPSDSHYYRVHQENTSQIDIQKALQHFHEQDKMLSDRLTVLEAAASKPQQQQQQQVSTSEVIHQRRVMKPGTPQKMVQQSSQKKEVPKMKLPNAGSNVLLEGSIDMSEESQATSTQEKVTRSPVKEQANRSEKKEQKKNSHRSDRVDTADYMSVTAEESARPKVVNTIQPKSSELSLKNNRTLNLLEYEDQLRRSHTDTMHARTHSQDIKIPPKVSTPVNRTSAAPPQRSYTPTPQTRTRFDLTNNYQQHNTTIQDQPRSPRPIFSHASSAVLDPILTPIKGCLMEDIFNCKEAPLGNQREEPVYQDNKIHGADRKLLNIQSTRSHVMNRAQPSQSPDHMLRASVDYQHYHPNQHHNGVTTPQGSFHPSFLKQTGPREIQSATKAELSWANGPKMMSSGKKNYGGGYQEVELYEDEHGHIIEQPKQVSRKSYGPRRDTEGPVMHESESYHQTSPLRYRKEPVSPYNKGQYQYQEGNMGSVKWRLEVQENGNASALLGSPLDRMDNARRSTNRSNIRDITGHYTQGEPSYRSYTQDTEGSMRKEHKLKAGIPGIRKYNEKPRDYVTVHDMSPPDSHRKVYKMSSQAKHNFIVDTRSPTLAMTSETLAKHPEYYANVVDTKKWDGYGRESGSYSIQRNYLVGEGDTLKRAAPSQFF